MSIRTASTVLLSLMVATLLGACDTQVSDPEPPPARSPVGNLADKSYYGQRGRVRRPNANGELIALEQFEGQFIWADYAAPWCSPCGPQTRAVQTAAGAFGSEVVFITIMTSDMGGYGDPATVATAERWARQFGLDREHVLAADLTAMTVPKHILFSPEGQVLYERTATLSAAEIRSILSQHLEQ